MASLLVIRRILALTLVVTLASMGVPVPVNASGEQEQPSARNSILTLNGQPIRQFISTTGHSRDVFLFSGLTPAHPPQTARLAASCSTRIGSRWEPTRCN